MAHMGSSELVLIDCDSIRVTILWYSVHMNGSF